MDLRVQIAVCEEMEKHLVHFVNNERDIPYRFGIVDFQTFSQSVSPGDNDVSDSERLFCFGSQKLHCHGFKCNFFMTMPTRDANVLMWWISDKLYEIVLIHFLVFS